jgi:hypothetical protein
VSQLQHWYADLSMTPAQPTPQSPHGYPVCAPGGHPRRAPAVGILLVALTLLLGSATLMLAQEATAPVLTPTLPTTATPTTAAPLEPIPSLPERLLAPIPERFNWLQRDVRSNPWLASLAGMFETPQQRQGPSQLLLTLSLSEEYSDNFFRRRDVPRDEYRTRASFGTLYRYDDGPAFVSLANTLSATYRVKSEESTFGFTNLSLNAGYSLPRLSFGLTESFVRDDGTSDESAEIASRAISRGNGTFMRNQVSPQVQYEISSLTSVGASYTNIITRDDQRFVTDLNSPVPEINRGNSVSHGFSATLKHAFSAFLNASIVYSITRSENDTSGDSLINNLSADAAYRLTSETSAISRIFGRIIDRSGAGVDSQSYGFSLGARHLLTSSLAVTLSMGPTLLERDGVGQRVILNWQASIDGSIPIFQTRDTTLTLSTAQGVDDTSTDVDNVGLVLRQSISATLDHAVSGRLKTSLYANFTHTEPLETTDPNNSSLAKDNFWSTGARATYLLTRVISLSADYRYQRRDSSREIDDFDENRVTVSVSGTLPVF